MGFGFGIVRLVEKVSRGGASRSEDEVDNDVARDEGGSECA